MWILDNWPAGTLLLAGILAAVATYVSSNRQAENETHVNKSLGSANELLTKATSAQEIADRKLTEANSKLDQAVTKQDDALALHNQSLTLQQEAGEDQKKANESLGKALLQQESANEMLRQTIQADRELIAKQQEVLDNFTGGDSVFYLRFKNIPGEAPHAHYEVLGKYPLRSVSISALNFDVAAELEGQPLHERMRKAVHNTSVDLAWTECGLIMGNFPDRTKWEGNYQIIFSQQNGSTLQLLRLKRLGSDTAFATRVFRRVGGVEDGMGEYVEIKSLRRDAGFPKDESGKVEWLDYVDSWSKSVRVIDSPDLEQSRETPEINVDSNSQGHR